MHGSSGDSDGEQWLLFNNARRIELQMINDGDTKTNNNRNNNRPGSARIPSAAGPSHRWTIHGLMTEITGTAVGDERSFV